jgi:putative chitinase
MDNKNLIDELLELSDPKLDNKIINSFKVKDGLCEDIFEKTQEGYKFRGRGYIQLTGKENYTAFGKAINEDICSNPDKVANNYALLSAAWFFSKNGLHKIADEGSSDVVVTKITKRVNGGTIGLPDRIKHFKEYYSLLA